MTASNDGPRLVRPDEFREAMVLTERCFGFDSDGKIVSHIACVPTELQAGNIYIECHGIAGVATGSDYRGNGYTHQLLKFWLNHLNDRDIPLAGPESDRV